MDVVSLRISLNGVKKNQINNLFSLIDTLKTPINISRASHKKFSYSRVDLILTGLFPLHFLQKFGEVFSSTIGVTFNISNYSHAIANLEKYATLKWELDTITTLLGVSIFPRSVMKQIFGIKDDQEFLKLLLMTPASSYIKNYLIIKPKGVLSFTKNRLYLFLSNQSIAFVVQWLTKVMNNNEIETEFLNGSTGELEESNKIKLDIPPQFFDHLKSWQNLVQKNTIDDFDLVYYKLLKLISKEEVKPSKSNL